ncbi:MAG: HNH endonuclease [Planctomycetota bacterium]
MNINRFFTDTLGAELKNPRWSWGATDVLNHRVFLRVWQDGIRDTKAGQQVRIAHDEPRRESNGFTERHAHIDLIRAGAEGFGVVCTAVDPDTTEARKIKSFDEHFLIRFGAIIRENEGTFAEIVARVPIGELERPQTGEGTLTKDLREISRQKIDTTTKVALVNARVGQGLFRSQVLKVWGHCCAVTGSTTRDAIRASHIKPWRRSSNDERLDPQNGLPLIASLDALFDAGLISFDSDGNLLVSDQLDPAEQSIFSIVDRSLKRAPTKAAAEYLAYHRQHVFRK